MILLMKCLLTPDCSRVGAVPATQRTSPDPAFFSAPDPTHREYIYYHMTTPHQLCKSGSPRFLAKCARPLSFVKAGSGNETRSQGARIRGKDVHSMNLSHLGVASVMPHLFIASLQKTQLCMHTASYTYVLHYS